MRLTGQRQVVAGTPASSASSTPATSAPPSPSARCWSTHPELTGPVGRAQAGAGVVADSVADERGSRPANRPRCCRRCRPPSVRPRAAAPPEVADGHPPRPTRSWPEWARLPSSLSPPSDGLVVTGSDAVSFVQARYRRTACRLAVGDKAWSLLSRRARWRRGLRTRPLTLSCSSWTSRWGDDPGPVAPVPAARVDVVVKAGPRGAAARHCRPQAADVADAGVRGRAVAGGRRRGLAGVDLFGRSTDRHQSRPTVCSGSGPRSSRCCGSSGVAGHAAARLDASTIPAEAGVSSSSTSVSFTRGCCTGRSWSPRAAPPGDNATAGLVIVTGGGSRAPVHGRMPGRRAGAVTSAVVSPAGGVPVAGDGARRRARRDVEVDGGRPQGRLPIRRPVLSGTFLCSWRSPGRRWAGQFAGPCRTLAVARATRGLQVRWLRRTCSWRSPRRVGSVRWGPRGPERPEPERRPSVGAWTPTVPPMAVTSSDDGQTQAEPDSDRVCRRRPGRRFRTRRAGRPRRRSGCRR